MNRNVIKTTIYRKFKNRISLFDQNFPVIYGTLCLILFILFYFLFLRPLRSFISGNIIYPFAESISYSRDFLILSYSEGAPFITVFVVHQQEWLELMFKVPFDLFFLIAVIFLIIIRASKEPYLLITLIHIIGGILVTGCIFLGLSFYTSFLFIMDALTVYIIPSFTLILVILYWKKDALQFNR